MTNGRELTNRRCCVNAASLYERGYSQLPRVPALPVWDDASTQIIHVNKCMSLTRRPSPTTHKTMVVVVHALKEYQGVEIGKNLDRHLTLGKPQNAVEQARVQESFFLNGGILKVVFFFFTCERSNSQDGRCPGHPLAEALPQPQLHRHLLPA